VFSSIEDTCKGDSEAPSTSDCNIVSTSAAREKGDCRPLNVRNRDQDKSDRGPGGPGQAANEVRRYPRSKMRETSGESYRQKERHCECSTYAKS
jgi:hypothetical protein